MGKHVKINGVTHQTVMIDGTQRFPENRIVRHLLDACRAKGLVNLSSIASSVDQGIFSEDEFKELYRLIGYSVTGYREIFYSDTVETDEGMAEE